MNLFPTEGDEFISVGGGCPRFEYNLIEVESFSYKKTKAITSYIYI